MDYQTVAEILKTMGHPVRIKILQILNSEEPLNVNAIVEKTNYSQSTVSQHLSMLRNKKLIKCKKNGVFSYYKIADKGVKDIVNCLNNHFFS